jgi:hypothetical protein
MKWESVIDLSSWSYNTLDQNLVFEILNDARDQVAGQLFHD